MLYHDLQDKLNELRKENLQPKYIILGYEKVRQLEDELDAAMLQHDQSTEEFMKRGAAGRVYGCDFFINQVVGDKVSIITEKEFKDIKNELEYKKEKGEG